MGKQLDKDMRMMSITERFNYLAAKKKMMLDISSLEVVDLEDLKKVISSLLDDRVSKHDPKDDTWVDEEDSDYDNFSDGEDSGCGGDYDDANEY